TPLEILGRVLAEEPARPRALNPKVDRDLETVCLACLEKSPGKRYATAEELADELQRWHDGGPIQRRPLGSLGRAWRWCRRNAVVAGLLLAVTLASVGMGVLGMLAARQAQRATAQERKTKQALEEVEGQLAFGLLRPLGSGIEEDPTGTAPESMILT